MTATPKNVDRLMDYLPGGRGLSLEEVTAMIVLDVAELRKLYELQAEDASVAADVGRQPDYRIRTLIKAWEHAQDEHWSWYREILNANTTAAEGPQGLGQGFMGIGNGVNRIRPFGVLPAR